MWSSERLDSQEIVLGQPPSRFEAAVLVVALHVSPVGGCRAADDVGMSTSARCRGDPGDPLPSVGFGGRLLAFNDASPEGASRPPIWRETDERGQRVQQGTSENQLIENRDQLSILLVPEIDGLN